jgi:hypothetical protein
VSRCCLHYLLRPPPEVIHLRMKASSDGLRCFQQRCIDSEHTRYSPAITYAAQQLAKKRAVSDGECLLVAQGHGSILSGPMMMCFHRPPGLCRYFRCSLHWSYASWKCLACCSFSSDTSPRNAWEMNECEMGLQGAISRTHVKGRNHVDEICP